MAKRPKVGLAGIGLELTAAVVGGLLLGLWIDRHFETSPWAAVIGGTVGIVGGLVNFVRQAQRAMDEVTGSPPSPSPSPHALPPSPSLRGERDAPSREDGEE